MLFDAWNYRQLKRFSIGRGAELFGVADISDESVKGGFHLSDAVKNEVSKAVCLGVGLSALLLSEIESVPTKLYFHHYRTVNMFLDQLAFVVSRWITKKGFLALPVPASMIVDWELQTAHASHKKIGCLAGLGWIGRNNLLVSEKFGAQFRLVAVLTNMNLKTDKPLIGDCGVCAACLEVCPVGAIGESPADFKHLVCFKRLKDLQRQNIVGQFICGVCVKACGPQKNGTFPRLSP